MAEQSESITNANLDGLEDNQVYGFWNKEIGRTKRYFQDWWDVSDNIYDRYRDERVGAAYFGRRTAEGGRLESKRFNILWSNIKTLFPALYSGPPKPVVRRRYKDSDPMGRLVVEITERSLEFVQDPVVEQGSYDAAVRHAVLDYLLVGRGVVWQRYEKTTEQTETSVQVIDPETDEEITETETEERTVDDQIFHEHVQYRDFLHMVAPTWDQIQARGWVARCYYMTKPEIAEKFGAEVAQDISMTASDTVSENKRSTSDPNRGKPKNKVYAEVWEIWNIPNRKIYYYSSGSKELLKDKANPEGEDPLRLRNFYPCPKPLYATTTPDTLVPVADYVEYYDQAQNLDQITNQKWALTTALRVAGFYAGKEANTFQQLFDGSNRNLMIPVQDWDALGEGNKVANNIAWLPLDIIQQALVALQNMEEANKQQIYEITGIADIIRGQSKASETLGAQRLKGQWASVRLSDRQRTVGQFNRDVLRIDAEIIAEHYDTATIAEMTNFTNSELAESFGDVFVEAVGLMRDDRLRNFRVDVETQDTVFADEMQERGQNVEMLGGMAEFMGSAGELGGQNPLAIPVLGEMLKIGLKSFSGSAARELEMYVDEMVARMEEQAERAMNTPPPPTPEQMREDREAKKDAFEAQATMAETELEARGQLIDLQTKTRDQALERRQQDLEFMSRNQDRLAQLLARAGNA